MNSYAATASIVKNFKGGTVFASTSFAIGGFSLAYNDFAKGAFNAGYPKITSVSYKWTPYTNGRTEEKVELCDTPWTGNGTLENWIVITGGQTGTTTAFNNAFQLNYGSGMWIRHTLTGGTYPALRPDAGDSITINYSY